MASHYSPKLTDYKFGICILNGLLLDWLSLPVVPSMNDWTEQVRTSTNAMICS